MSLKDKAKRMNAGQGIPFMEGREKGDVKDLYGKIVTVREYGFIQGDDGPYLVFIVEEDEKNFFFGASVITQNFEEFDDEDKAELRKSGLPIKLDERDNKKGTRKYQAVEFYPEGWEKHVTNTPF